MSLLTEQEIIETCAENGLEFCPNWGTAFTGNTEIIRIVHAVEAKMIEKIKAQGPAAWMAKSGSTVLNEDVEYIPNWTDYYSTPLYRLPSDGD